MKLTDFALIFVGITLPIIIVVYINVSFTIKAQEQEMYYKKIINVALKDASNEMKEVENQDAEIDYGYSGSYNNKISVNSQIAVDTFLNSLYNNFGIKGNTSAESYLQYFIPAIAVIDYNGVQVSSIEEYTDSGETVQKHELKPKRYYSYTYYLYWDSIDNKEKYTENFADVKNNLISTHYVEFTMDDYITHRATVQATGEIVPVKSFYISDNKNNKVLVGDGATNEFLDTVVENLKNKRKEVIIDTIQKEMEYATNNNNFYASSAGIKYNFVFPTLEEGEMESQIKNVGMMALVQGISIGNKYLNTRAYSTAKLTEITRYYLSVPKSGSSNISRNLYHKDKNCPEYIASTHDNITPSYLSTKQQAASVKAIYKKGTNQYITLEGFYPCPICNP